MSFEQSGPNNPQIVSTPPQMILVQASASVSGPLPPPEVLAGYERVLPGAAERIIATMERQAKHRQNLERLKIEGPIEDARAARREAMHGQICATLVAALAFSAAVIIMCIAQNAATSAVACVIGGTTVGGMVYAFVTGRKASQSKKETPEAEKNSS